MTSAEPFPRHPFFRAEALAARPYALDEPGQPLRLHQNEGTPLSPELASGCARALLAALGERPQNLYPNLVPRRLIDAFARYLEVAPENVEVTSGSSQGLALLAQACFEPGRSVAIASPSFSLFEGFARLHGARVVPIELNARMEYVAETILAPEVLAADVIILCTPNNPTGGVCPADIVDACVSRARGLVVVDEAYVEFAFDDGVESFARKATRTRNLLVLRTLSKAWAAAGLRVGAMVGAQETIDVFRALKPPYSIPFSSEAIAGFLLEERTDDLRERVRETRREKASLEAFLRTVKELELYESHANFVCFRHPRAAALEEHLRTHHAILVRHYGQGRLRDVVRASLWTPSENLRFQSALKEFFA